MRSFIERGWIRGAALLSGGVLVASVVSGCGGSSFKDKPRPPVPIQLTGVITDKNVTVSPAKFGAGPITLVISNQTQSSHTVTLEGAPLQKQATPTQTVGPINPLDTANIQQTLKEGKYVVKVSSNGGIKAATLVVGPPRPSSSNTLLLP
ncbi:MAG: hypothetical protein ACJ768_22785 [Gaiellaceae bacterium]